MEGRGARELGGRGCVITCMMVKFGRVKSAHARRVETVDWADGLLCEFEGLQDAEELEDSDGLEHADLPRLQPLS